MKKQDIGSMTFAEIITNVGDGDLERRLNSEIREVVNAVSETHKAGKINITINVVQTDKGLISILAETKTTIPKPSIESTTFFKDDRGGLYRDNPNQTKLGWNINHDKD